MAVEQRIINAESGGRTHVRNPRSSAYGPGQFLDSTWLTMISRYRPDLMQGRAPADILALRTDPALSAEMTKRYGEENARYLAAQGLTPDEGNIYLAHFAGPAGAVKLLKNPDKPASEVLGPRVVEANPFLANWKARDVDAWADRKMGWTPMTGAPAASSSAREPSSGAMDVALNSAALTPGTTAAAMRPAQPKKDEAVLPFLASMLGMGGGAAGAGAAGAAGAGGLGAQLAGSGGLLGSLFGGEGGMDFSAMMNNSDQPDPANPVAGAQANPLGMLPKQQIDMSGLQALLQKRPQLGGPRTLR